MTERKPRSMSPESWAEQQIVDAQARGEMDPGRMAGQPLDLSDAGHPDWWIRRKLKAEQLDMPPSLQLRQDRDDFLATLADLPNEDAVRLRAEAINGRIRYANSHGITGPPVALMPMDVDVLVERWRQAQQDD